MPGYREITVANEGRPRRPGRAARNPAPLDWRAMLRGSLARAVTLCRRSPGTALGAVVAVAAAGLVCVNALGHQSGPHPFPILPKVAAKAPEPVKGAAKPDPAPAPKQAARDAIGDLIRSDETTASVTPKPQPAKPQPAKPQPAKPPPARDATKPAAKADKAESTETPLLRAQRALAKLGYGIKPDGAMGPGTRAALEKFERDRKLPVTGEAVGKTLRALMAQAGQG